MAGLLRRHVYPSTAVGLVVASLAAFVLTEQLHVPLLTDPRPGLGAGSWSAGLLEVSLLIADVVLPVPSSAVMFVQGAVYGLVAGTALSLIGGTGATLTAFFLGQRSRGLLARLAGPEQQARATALLDRYGVWAVILSRPVPMLAESVAIMSGTGRLRWWQVAGAGVVGNLGPALGYAAMGAYATTFVNALVVFGALMLIAAVIWLVQRHRQRRR